MKQWRMVLFLVLAAGLLPGVFTACTSNPEAVYAPGTYTADAMGNNGRVFVRVTLSAGRIDSVEVDTNYETKGLGDVAANVVAKAIVDGQTLVVDTVAGATFSSKAVLTATKKALESAGADLKALLIPADPSRHNKDLGSIKADVIVVGGGLAGMSAALRAAQEGASVILYERSGVLGGAARYAVGWISGAGFRIQKEQGVTGDTPEAFYRDIIGFAGSERNVNPEIAKYYAANSGPAIDWLQDAGVEFKNELNVGIYDPMSVYRVAWGKNGGVSLIQGLQNAIDRQVAAGKINCRLFTEVTGLIMSDSTVTGVKTVDRHGNTGTGTAKSIILTTGGIGASQERLERIFKNIAVGYISTADGSGYKLAEQAGAAFHTLNYNPITGGVLPVDGFYSNVRMDVRYNGVIFVDQNGRRVFDEIGSNYKKRSDAWIHADQNILYGIVSESMLNREKPLLSAGNSWTPTPDRDWAIFNRMVQEGALIYKADTIEELAGKIGVDAAAFKSTIARYNGYAVAGRDEEFGRTNNLIVFDTGPFYALKTIPYAGRSAGGPVADAKMQVLNTRGVVIPGLYIAGEIIGFSAISGEASVSGMYLGEAVTFGNAAALSAARYALGN
jgi:succinate dehydrogenase/fumarate reductase flavoprotein subunit/uncharacterized protein with FMN-binding domain